MKVATWKSIVATCCLLALVVAPAPVWAQTDQASIAGSVVDETAGAMPGVTVVVTSDALIEQTRTAVTDSSGNYQIIRLPAGDYTVTFTLPGFNTVVQEGIVLSGNFAAPVDAVLPIGELSESVTVTSAAPLVDIVSTRQQSTMTAERVNVLPGAAGLMTAAQYVPGVTLGGGFANLPSIHGSDPLDGQPAIDGVKTGTQLQGRNQWNTGVGTVTNEALVTEVVVETASQNAEFAQSGVRTNLIPKSGGNSFSFEFFARGTTDKFASDNQSQELKDRGFRFAPAAYSWNINPAGGGPILQDKLWFFASALKGQRKNFILDKFFDLDEPSTPDSVTGDDLRAFIHNKNHTESLRITHQVTPRNKVTYSFISQRNVGDRAIVSAFGNISPEAAYWYNLDPAYHLTGRWTAPVTSRVLIEADIAWQQAGVNTGPMDHGGELRMAKTDLVTGKSYNSTFQNYHNQDYHRRANASMSYVTGSHNFKLGMNYANNKNGATYTPPGEIRTGYFQNGVPDYVRVVGSGNNTSGYNMNCDCGIYVQDAYTRDRLTLNAGFRYDYFNLSVPGGSREAGFFADAISLPDPVVENVPNWKNYNGRIGGAYDLFGDGSTAIKASAGRYVSNEGMGVAQGFNPISTGSDQRVWTDLNGDLTALNPDGTPQFDEIGPSFNPNFGTRTITTTLDPDMGRSTNWEYSAGIERQLGPGWAISGMWHHRTYGNYRWRDNLNNSPADYFLAGTFTGPDEPNLPESARNRTIPVFNIRPGEVVTGGNNLLTQAADDSQTWNGFEVIVDGELPRGGFMTASITAGTSHNYRCQTGLSDNPNRLLDCDISRPYRPLSKLSGALPLPFDTMISGIFQVFPGAERGATYVMNTADFPDLDFGPGQSQSLSFNLIEPGTEFESIRTNLQLRFSKVITTRNVRTRVYMDANNLFNQARVTSRQRFYGGGGIYSDTYDRINRIERGRVLTFGLQSSF